MSRKILFLLCSLFFISTLIFAILLAVERRERGSFITLKTPDGKEEIVSVADYKAKKREYERKINELEDTLEKEQKEKSELQENLKETKKRLENEANRNLELLRKESAEKNPTDKGFLGLGISKEDFNKLSIEGKKAFIRKLVGELDWDKIAEVMILLFELSEEGEPDWQKLSRENPDFINTLQELGMSWNNLALLLKDDKELLKYMGDLWTELYTPSLFKALGIKVNENQIPTITDILSERSDLYYDLFYNEGDYSFLPKYKEAYETILKQKDDLSRLLPGDDVSKYIDYAYLETSSEQKQINVTSDSEAINQVYIYWDSWLKPDKNSVQQKSTLKDYSELFYTEYKAINDKYRNYYGENLNTEQKIRLRMEQIDLQVRYEQKLADYFSQFSEKPDKLKFGTSSFMEINIK